MDQLELDLENWIIVVDKEELEEELTPVDLEEGYQLIVDEATRIQEREDRIAAASAASGAPSPSASGATSSHQPPSAPTSSHQPPSAPTSGSSSDSGQDPDVAILMSSGSDSGSDDDDGVVGKKRKGNNIITIFLQ